MCTCVCVCVCVPHAAQLISPRSRRKGGVPDPVRMLGSGPKGLLGQVARHRVEEKGEEWEPQCGQQQVEGQPATRGPQEEVGTRERVQAPEEARVGPAGAARGAEAARTKDTEDEGWGVVRAPAKMVADPWLSSWFQAPHQPRRLPGAPSPPLQLFVFGKNEEDHLTQLSGAFPGRGAAFLYWQPMLWLRGRCGFWGEGEEEGSSPAMRLWPRKGRRGQRCPQSGGQEDQKVLAPPSCSSAPRD